MSNTFIMEDNAAMAQTFWQWSLSLYYSVLVSINQTLGSQQWPLSLSQPTAWDRTPTSMAMAVLAVLIHCCAVTFVPLEEKVGNDKTD